VSSPRWCCRPATSPCPTCWGVLAGAGTVGWADLYVLAGLYIGFIGRILLKDFRDVRGDALFGKRTFLVRHGRRATSRFSAVCWVAGTTVLVAGAPAVTAVFACTQTLALGLALAMLRLLAAADHPRRQERLISAIAIVGRGMIVMLLAHLAMTAAGWPAVRYDLVLAALAMLMTGQATMMYRYGPPLRPVPLPAVVPARAAGQPKIAAVVHFGP
jgi:hypothetical protein